MSDQCLVVRRCWDAVRGSVAGPEGGHHQLSCSLNDDDADGERASPVPGCFAFGFVLACVFRQQP